MGWISDRLRRFVIAVFVGIIYLTVRDWPDRRNMLLWPRGVIMEGLDRIREKALHTF
jgi:hypothetical protein